jgi:ribonuclease HI
MATKLNWDLGLSNVILEVDSLLVVQALRNMSPNWSSYGPVIEDARGKLYIRQSWMVSHVKREANSRHII